MASRSSSRVRSRSGGKRIKELERRVKKDRRASLSHPSHKRVGYVKRKGAGAVFPCTLCPYQFKSPIDLEEHRLAEHLDLEDLDEKQYICEGCNAIFSASKYLKKHGEICPVTTVPVGSKDGSKRVKIDPFFVKIEYDKPVVFMMDEETGEMGLNDDVVSKEDAYSYYEEPFSGFSCPYCCQNTDEDCDDDEEEDGTAAGCDDDEEEDGTADCDDDEEEDGTAAGCDDDEEEDGTAATAGKNVINIPPKLKQKYTFQYRHREGFDLAYQDYAEEAKWNLRGLPSPMGPLSEYDVEFQDMIKKFAVLAIKRYNVMNHGLNYRCLEFVDANISYGGSVSYFHITFTAAQYAITGDYILTLPQIFQATILSSFAGGGSIYERRVRLCRLKSESQD